MPSSVQKIQGVLSRKTGIHGESGTTRNSKMDIWMLLYFTFRLDVAFIRQGFQ